MDKEILFKDLSYQIIGICFKVHTKLGCSLPEHCYHEALYHEFTRQDIPCTSQQKFEVYYDNVHVGHFFTDLIIDQKVILELKSTECITSNHESQLLTYLRAAKLKVGYIVNFGYHHMQYKRLIL